MESLIVLGLASVGAYLNKNKAIENIENLDTNNITEHEQIAGRNIYNTRRLKKLYRDIDITAANNYKKSRNS